MTRVCGLRAIAHRGVSGNHTICISSIHNDGLPNFIYVGNFLNTFEMIELKQHYQTDNLLPH